MQDDNHFRVELRNRALVERDRLHAPEMMQHLGPDRELFLRVANQCDPCQFCRHLYHPAIFPVAQVQ